MDATRQDYTHAMVAQAEQLFAPGTGATPPAVVARAQGQVVLSCGLIAPVPHSGASDTPVAGMERCRARVGCAPLPLRGARGRWRGHEAREWNSWRGG